MKSNLRRIFGSYDNSGLKHYAVMREALKEGLTFNIDIDLRNTQSLSEEDVVYILGSVPWVALINTNEKFFLSWHKLCIFEDDVLEIQVNDYPLKKVRLTSMGVFLKDQYENGDLRNIKVKIVLKSMGEYGQKLERDFFGPGMNDLMQLWQKRIVIKAKSYVEEVYNLEVIGDIPSREKLKEMITKYRDRLKYWNIQEVNSLEDKSKLFLSDFGIKDPSLFALFMFAFNKHTQNKMSDLEEAQHHHAFALREQEKYMNQVLSFKSAV